MKHANLWVNRRASAGESWETRRETGGKAVAGADEIGGKSRRNYVLRRVRERSQAYSRRILSDEAEEEQT